MAGHVMKAQVRYTLVVNPDVLKAWWLTLPESARGTQFSARRALRLLARQTQRHGHACIERELLEAERALP